MTARSNKRGLRGYRLHVRRYKKACGSGIRTFKFPLRLTEPQAEEMWRKADAEHQAVMEGLLRFWETALRAGGFFQGNANALNRAAEKIAGKSFSFSEARRFDTWWDSLPDNLRVRFDREAVKSLLKTRTNIADKGLKIKTSSCFADSSDSGSEGLFREIRDGFSRGEKGGELISAAIGRAYGKPLPPMLKSDESDRSPLDKITFILSPEIPIAENQSLESIILGKHLDIAARLKEGKREIHGDETSSSHPMMVEEGRDAGKPYLALSGGPNGLAWCPVYWMAQEDARIFFSIRPPLQPDSVYGAAHQKKFRNTSRFLTSIVSQYSDDVLGVLGLNDNQNALSNYFGPFLDICRKAVPTGLAELFQERFPDLWAKKEEDLVKRCGMLIEAARQIPFADTSWLASNWAEYRQHLGGKLQSWTSNFLNRIGAIYEGASRLDAWAEDVQNDPGWETQSETIMSLRDQISHLLEESDGEIPVNADRLAAVERIRSGKFRLEETAERIDLENNEGRSSDAKEGKRTIPDIPPYPVFFGKRKREERDRFERAWMDVKEAIIAGEMLCDALESMSGNRPIDTAKTAQSLLKISRHLVGALKGKSEAILREMCSEPDSFNPTSDRQAFYVSPFARKSGVQMLELRPGIEPSDILGNVRSILPPLEMSKTDPAGLLALSEDGASVDSVDRFELIKWLWGARVAHVEDEAVLPVNVGSVARDVASILKGVDSLKALPENSRTVKQARVLLQAGCGGLIRGALGLLSRRIIVEMRTLQTTNGEEAKLMWVPKHSDSELLDELARTFALGNKQPSDADLHLLRETPHSWHVVLEGGLTEAGIRVQGVIVGKSTDKEPFSIRYRHDKDRRISIPLVTPVAMRQFLEWHLSPGLKHAFVTIQGPSLIMERENRVHWIGEKSVMSPTSIRAYLALPFGISTDAEGTPPEPKRLMGIDINARALGWCVIDSKILDERGVASSIVDCGLIRAPQLWRITKHIRRWKEDQARGSFGMASTKLENMRDAAAGAIRNELHAIALKHNALLCYEKEIDVFEQGADRVRTLYRTIKQGDVPAKTDADKTRKKQSWSKSYRAGGEVAAYATSQTCRRCGRFAFAHLDKDKRYGAKDGIVELKDGHVKVEHPDGKLTASELRGIVRYRSSGDAEGGRGGRDLFRCPYDDCGFSTDADVQAALNIALKAHLGGFPKKEEWIRKSREWKDEGLTFNIKETTA